MNLQTDAYEKWTELAKKIQEPFQAIAELNIKTLQDLSYLKPQDLASLKKPEELMEKQLNVAIDNGHKALEHMQKSMEIIEKAMHAIVPDAKSGKQ